MSHVTYRLTTKNWDQLRNPTFGSRVFATFTFFTSDYLLAFSVLAFSSTCVFSAPEMSLHSFINTLKPLPLTVFSKMQIGFTFLLPAHPGSPRQRAVKRVCVCVCVCYCRVLVKEFWKLTSICKVMGKVVTTIEVASGPSFCGTLNI